MDHIRHEDLIYELKVERQGLEGTRLVIACQYRQMEKTFFLPRLTSNIICPLLTLYPVCTFFFSFFHPSQGDSLRKIKKKSRQHLKSKKGQERFEVERGKKLCHAQVSIFYLCEILKNLIIFSKKCDFLPTRTSYFL